MRLDPGPKPRTAQKASFSVEPCKLLSSKNRTKLRNKPAGLAECPAVALDTCGLFLRAWATEMLGKIFTAPEVAAGSLRFGGAVDGMREPFAAGLVLQASVIIIRTASFNPLVLPSFPRKALCNYTCRK